MLLISWGDEAVDFAFKLDFLFILMPVCQQCIREKFALTATDVVWCIPLGQTSLAPRNSSKQTLRGD